MEEAFHKLSQEEHSGDKLTMGTLVHWAREGGWRPLHDPLDGTDTELVDVFLTQHGHLLCKGDGRFHIFSPESGLWSADDFDGRLQALVRRLPNQFAADYAALPDGEETARRRLAKLIQYTGKKTTIFSVATLTRSELQHRTHAVQQEMNPDLEALHCANGVLNLRTGALRPARPEDRCTLSTGVAYDPGADTDAFHAVVLATQGGDAEMAEYLQRVFGYAATGLTREQALFILWGGGSNGKNLITDSVKVALGGYSATMDTRVLSSEASSSTGEYEKATYPGRRFGLSSEYKEQVSLNEPFVKSLTGDHTLKSRQIYGSPFEYTPRLKPFILTNPRPRVEGNDDGIWRRVWLIPFGVSFGTERQVAEGLHHAVADTGLLDRFVSPQGRQQALRWIAEGARKYLTDGGLRTPRRVTDATAQYRREEDYLGQFLQATCDYIPKAEIDAFKEQERRIKDMPESDRLYVEKAHLYKTYTLWCDVNGHNPISGTRFKVRVLSTRRFCDAEDSDDPVEMPRLESHVVWRTHDKQQVYRYVRLNKAGKGLHHEF